MTRVACVGAIVVDGDRLLLVRRAHPPAEGRWSLPGGRIEPGESAAEAVAREVREETGLDVRPGPVIGRVKRPGPEGVTYVIDDLACTRTGGLLRAGDDAAEARFVPFAEVPELPLTDGLHEVLRQWRVLP